MVTIDINADVGEGCGDDAALMRSITSANVAAGFHAGSPSVLRDTVRLALRHGVAIGAHPGFPDREDFGRRELSLPVSEIEDLVLYQIAAVGGVAAAEGGRLRHVKPHGALYNMAARDAALAAGIVRAMTACDPALILFAPAHSALFAAGRAAGLRVAAEVFADRAYRSDGSLAPRQEAGSVIEDLDTVISRALAMVRERRVVATGGSSLSIEADTICVHGDTPGSAALAAALRAALEAAGVTITAF